MKRIVITSLAVAVVGLFTGLSAKAQTYIINETMSTGLSAGASFSHYGPGGDGTYGTNSIVAGAGPGGLGAWQIVLTAASGSAGYSYYGAQYQNGNVTGTDTDANLSDYTISFEAMANRGSLNLQIQSWTGTGFGGSMTGTLNTAPVSPGYGNDQPLYNTWTQYTLNLGNTSIFQGNSGFLPDEPTWQIAFQLNGGGSTPYTETLDVANLTVTVPEPSTFALAGLGAATLLLFRRRK